MKINEAGLNLIKSFEGCRLKAYADLVGVWTIGYGHTGGVADGDEIDQATADELLIEDLARFEEGVSDLLRCEVSNNQFSALVCFAYNVGIGSLKSSHLMSKLNAGDVSGAADEFLRWDKAGGKEVAGLLRRRRAERALFLLAD